MVAATAVTMLATVWVVKRLVKPPTPSGKKRLTIFLRVWIGQYLVVTTLALLSVEHILRPRWLGVIALANFIAVFVIMWAALKRAPISDQDVTQEQRVRAVKSSKVMIAIYVFALINGIFHIRELPIAGLVAGIAVNILILAALITNLRRNQARLKQYPR